MRSTLFILALLLAADGNAKPLRSLKRQSEPVIEGYHYIGCYTDSTSDRALTGNTYFDDAMTVEKCAAACSGFTWFGVEYGRECYCGNSIDGGSVSTSETDCSFLCPGDGSEFCGAGNRLDMYSLTTATPPTASVSSFTFQGCYSDPARTGDPRALSDYVYYDDEMTVEKCQAACAGYVYSGIEYNRECYCGNTLTADTIQVSTSNCDIYMCNGDSTESCGGDWQLDLYQAIPTTSTSTSSTSTSIASTSTSTSTSSSTSSTSTSTTSSSAPSATGTTFQGCYNEPSNARALASHVYYDDDMTVEECGTACNGFKYFGIEYGRECYCGDILTAGTTLASPNHCDTFMCAGDSTESCGGNWQLDLYQTTVSLPASSYISQGCYTEATSERALSEAVFYDDSMTVEKCAVYCMAGQYLWFGVEYGRECYCGNTINAGSVPAPTTDCSFLCPGDPSTYCGAGNRLDMYQYGTLITTTSTSSTTSISSTTSTSSTSSTSSTTSTTSTSITTSTSSTSSSTSTPSTSSTSSTSGTSSTSSTSSSTITSSTTSTTSTASTISSTTSTTSTSTTSSGPSCATPLADPGFEQTNPSAVPWNLKINSPTLLTYNFMDTNTATGSIHGGAQQASLTYSAYIQSDEAWFNQPITVCPNTVYNLSAWVRRTVANDGCIIYYYIASADSSTVIQIMVESEVFSTQWTQVTSSWTSGTTSDVTFNIRTLCPAGAHPGRVHYFDDISFTAAS